MLLDRKKVYLFLLLSISFQCQATNSYLLTKDEYGIELLELSASKDYSLENFRKKVELLHLIAKTSESEHLLIDSLNYYMGEGVAEELYELIYKLGEDIVPRLEEELKTGSKCDKAYEDICLSSQSKRNAIVDLLNLLKEAKVNRGKG